MSPDCVLCDAITVATPHRADLPKIHFVFPFECLAFSHLNHGTVRSVLVITCEIKFRLEMKEKKNRFLLIPACGALIT